MINMKISATGLNLIKRFESCPRFIYLDAAGIPTGGWGHTSGLTKDDVGKPISGEQSQQWLLDDAKIAQDGVNDLLTVEVSQNQFDALCDFVFNEGVAAFRFSSLLKEINTGNMSVVPDLFLEWDKAHVDGKLVVLDGLLARRRAEVALWQSA